MPENFGIFVVALLAMAGIALLLWKYASGSSATVSPLSPELKKKHEEAAQAEEEEKRVSEDR